MSDDAAGDSDAPDRATPDGDCAEVAEDAEQIAAAIEQQIGLEKQDLLFLKLLPDVVDKLRDMTSEGESGRVKFAAERGLVAIAERVARMFRRDLAVDKG